MKKLGIVTATVVAAVGLVSFGWALGRQDASTKVDHESLYAVHSGNWTGSDIPVRACPTTYGVGPGSSSGPKGPNQLKTSLTRDVAEQLAFYSDSSREVEPILGPDGWQCSISVGADGTTSVLIYPPGVLKPTSQSGSEETMGVAFNEIPACRECVGDLVCPIFVNALTQLGYTSPSTYCPGYEPTTESVRFLEGGPTSNYGLALVADPAGDSGTNELSGGDYAATGALDYAGGGEEPGASSVSCVLPQAHQDVCRAMVNRFVFIAGRD
jgi:hypothetical protein